MGNETCLRFPVIPAQKGLAELLHHLAFGTDPIAQSASRAATSSEPEFVRPLLDVRLCPKMLFCGQDNGGGKMRVDQLRGIFLPVLLLRPGLAINPRLTGRLPAHPPLNQVRLGFHGWTSTTELRDP